MKEIEVKILDIAPEDVVAKLKELGAEKTEQGIVNIRAYDFPDGMLLDKGRYVRVRKIAGRVELVFKDPIQSDDFKMYDETEIVVDDFDTACLLVEKIGLKCFREMEKYRASYKIGNVKIEIDKYPGLPWFFEVEGGSVESVMKTVSDFGFDFNDKNKVSSKMINEIYDLDETNCSFKQKGEVPDYDSLFI
ncbi:CYTH domain-containing protein [Candidatus Woesearchaeota archaeon]|nr:CYTH domain-containing protein [Candidatus Woesearchaeota archaeon]